MVISFTTKKELQRELRRSELRATRHFESAEEKEKILKRIHDIIDNGEETNELAVFTLNKIKRVLPLV